MASFTRSAAASQQGAMPPPSWLPSSRCPQSTHGQVLLSSASPHPKFLEHVTHLAWRHSYLRAYVRVSSCLDQCSSLQATLHTSTPLMVIFLSSKPFMSLLA